MAWIPISESNKTWTFSTIIPDLIFMEGSDVVATSSMFPTWNIEMEEASMLRVVVHEFSQIVLNGNPASSILFYNVDSEESSSSYNESTDPDSWEPTNNDSEYPSHQIFYSTADAQVEDSFRMTVYVWDEDDPPGPGPSPASSRGHVYEMDRGWSFDGMYIPHFLELNWYFGEDPFTYTGIQKVRVHGLSKGYVKLDITVNGMQTDYTEDYSNNPQHLDLLASPIPELGGFVAEDFYSATSYADVANRGISIQMKFSGRNKVCDLPEPAHVIQVLAIQQAPSGARAN